MSGETVLIADFYPLLVGSTRKNPPHHLLQQPETLNALVRPLSRSLRCEALVPESCPEAAAAFGKAGFNIHRMNGNRPYELNALIEHEKARLQSSPPDHLVVVSSDPAFARLCDSAAQRKIAVSVWYPDGPLPQELMRPEYNLHRLDELLAGSPTKTPRVAVYLDFENLYIGLEHKHLTLSPDLFVDTVQSMCVDLGSLAEVNAYADWLQISGKASQADSLQRALVARRVKTHYYISQHGKNSIDMAIANDVRSRIDLPDDSPDAIDVLVLGTCDRDFSNIAETALARGKQVVFLGVQGRFSKALKELAEVRFIDFYLPHTSLESQNSGVESDPTFALLMKIAVCIRRSSRESAKQDVLAPLIGARQLQQLIAEDKLKVVDCRGSFKLNLEQPVAFLAWWIVDRLFYLIYEKGLPYVDTAYLARGMMLDKRLQALNIGQSRFDAEQVLQRAACTGCIIVRPQTHPHDPQRLVDTWWLVGFGSDLPGS